ncbi:MAG TPA: hypothetical protein VIO84_05425 [Candidatus Dormibacteraeota bacterium]|jgi:uncharacterized membrane protein
MQAGLQLRTNSIRGIVFGIALGLATLALMVALLATHASVATSGGSPSTTVSAGDSRAGGATQESQHGNLAGGSSDGGSAPSGGHGSLP